MSSARFVLAFLILSGAALAACSGNFGSGTTPPGTLLPSGPLSGIAPTPSPTPNSASAIVTYGDTDAFQTMPTVEGYGGAIAFPVPSPKPSGFEAVPVGVTVGVLSPSDTPDLNLATAGTHPVKRERRARALVYISLLATRDITLSSFPRIAVDVPRDIVTTFKEDEIQLALYNGGTKDKTYRLAVAEHDLASPPPTPTPRPGAPLPPTPIPGLPALPSAVPGVPAPPSAGPSGSFPPPGSPLPLGGTPPPGGPGGVPLPGASAGPSPSPTLPPQRIVFAATATSLKLAANVPLVFAVYAYPKPEATPSPHPSGSGSPGPAASASGAPGAVPSGAAPAASGASTPAAAPSATAPAAGGSAAPGPSPT
jgi:hypothetical protein